MDRESAYQVVVDLLATQRNIEPGTIRPDDTLVGALGLDSLDATELLLALHERTGVKLRIPDVDELGTVDEVVTLLLAQLEGRPAKPS